MLSLEEYLKKEYIKYYKTAKEISKKENKKIYTDSKYKIYYFDKIVEKIFPQNKPPSVDGLIVKKK